MLYVANVWNKINSVPSTPNIVPEFIKGSSLLESIDNWSPKGNRYSALEEEEI